MESLSKLPVFLFAMAFADGQKDTVETEMNPASTPTSAVQASVAIDGGKEKGRINNLAAKLSAMVTDTDAEGLGKPVAGLSRIDDRTDA